MDEKPATEKGIDRFGFMIGNAGQKVFQKVFENPEVIKSLSANLQALMFEEKTTHRTQRELPKEEKDFQKIIVGFSEIKFSFESLNDIPIYLSRLPNKSAGIPPDRFLQYHIANYLNDVYILNSRLNAFITIIERMYNRKNENSICASKIKAAKVLVSGFDQIVNIRGKHVHSSRYDDDDFGRIRAYEFASHLDLGIKDVFFQMYRLYYKKVRKDWIARIETNNSKTREVVDTYFEILTPIIFSDNETWIIPK